MLDLGAVVGRVVLDTSAFDRGYTLTLRRMAQLGTDAEKSSRGVGSLDRSLIGAADSANKVTVSTTRLTEATTRSAAASEKDAAAARLRSDAARRVSVALATVADASAKVQQTTLREFAATQRLEAAYLGASTEAGKLASATARLASSEASAIAAADRQAAATEREAAAQRAAADAARASVMAQRQATTATRDLSVAQTEGAVAASRFKSGLKMAGELGLLIGGLELVKKAIDIGKQAADFQQKMLLIRTMAGASADEMKRMSDAVLNMSGDVATGPADLADALYHIEQNGLRGQKALDALRIGAEGAKIGMADVEDTTNTMTIAIASGIHGMNNMQRAMGFMIATAGTGDMRLKDLNEALSGGILSVAKGFGASLQDVAAVLATLGDNGIRGANAAQALRQTMMGFASPAKAGAAALADVGLGMTDLRDAMQKHGLVYAMNDLEKHMKQAGITGSKVGAFITTAFGKRAGAGVGVLMGEIDRLNTKYAEAEKGAATFGSRWQATTQTVAFQWSKLGAEAEAAGIKMANAVLPLAGSVGSGLASGLGGTLRLLEDLAPVLKVVGALWIGMWAGRAALVGIQGAVDALSSLRIAASNAFVDIQRFGLGVNGTARAASELTQTSAIMQAEFAKIAAAAEESAATQAEAQLAAMRTYQQVSEAEIAAMEATVVAAQAAAAETAAAAEEASAAVVASGETAEIGWAGLAGPLGAAALGLFAIVSMFHKSDTASKEATAAAKAYTDALKSDGSAGGDSIFGAIVTQLSDNKVPELLDQLNNELGKNAFTGGQFATAIEKGGAPLAALRDRLREVITAGTSTKTIYGPHGPVGQITSLTPAAKATTSALGHLNTQYATLTKSARQELVTAKSFHLTASSIDQVAQSTRLSSDQAKTYAAMLGFVADKNGIVAASSKDVNAAVRTVADAYKNATGTGQEFLSALDTFSKSGGTSADRAALIGATLKAANGDALGFAAAMNAASGADKGLADSMKQAASQVGKHGESVKALTSSVMNLKTGTIDYNNAAAAPLISGLQSMQSAAMAAASAMYQHEVATKGGRQAAQDAYNTYVAQTRGALIDEHTKLGLTADQAKRLGTEYFGIKRSGDIKKTIKAEGADKLVIVLDKLGRLLAHLTHTRWNINVTRTFIDHTNVSGNGGALGALPGFAKGGTVPPNTTATVGERGWELLRTDSAGRATILSHPQSRALTGMPARLPGYANGSLMGYVTGAGFRGRAAEIMDAIAWAESGGNASVINNNPATGDLSYGLTQINMIGALGPARRAQFHLASNNALLNPATNLRVAYALSGGGRDFSPWSTYKSGDYLTFMGKDGNITSTGGSGGAPVVPVKVHGGWQVGDTVYATKRAAENAARRLNSESAQQRRQEIRAQLTAGRHAARAGNKLGDMLGRNLHVDAHGRLHGSTVSVGDIRSQLAALGKDLRDAGASKKFIDRIKGEGRAILDAARARNRAAAQLEKAAAVLAKARAKEHADFVSFRSARSGIFDIATAGQDPVTGRITPGSILAQQRQAISRLKEWNHDLRHLAPLLPAGYFRQLENQSPDQALPELRALMHMNPGQFKLLRKQAGELRSLSGQGASFGARHLDQHAINVARRNERTAARHERQAQHELMQRLHHLDETLANLTIAGVAEIDLKKGTLLYRLEQDKHHRATNHRGRPKASNG